MPVGPCVSRVTVSCVVVVPAAFVAWTRIVLGPSARGRLKKNRPVASAVALPSSKPLPSRSSRTC
jgi:hypothetical protein